MEMSAHMAVVWIASIVSLVVVVPIRQGNEETCEDEEDS